MNKGPRIFMLSAVCMLAIGFAAVATTLTLNGNVTVGTNAEDFRVIFTKAEVDDTESTATITDNGKNIDFITRELTKLNDEVTLYYEISNYSKNYNVATTVTLNGIDEGQNEYFYVTKNEDWVTNHSGVIEASSRTHGTIKIKLTKLYEGSTAMEPVEFTLTITNSAVSIDELAPTLPERENISIARPVLLDSLTAVEIKDNGDAYVANPNLTNWYDYENKIWANAVELYEGAKYTENGENRDYTVGDKINPNDIRSYFVWIPKYRYKLWNVDYDSATSDTVEGKHLIEIKFERDINDNTDSANEGECTTPIQGTGENKQGISNSIGVCHNGDWMSHPAFLTMGVDGFWVAKFELGNKTNNGTTSHQTMTTSNVSNVVVKPGYYSWSNTLPIGFFDALKAYNTNMNSHMIKNTEWGAVAYLSHSKYGKGSKITLNNYLEGGWNVLTGYAANPGTDQSGYPGTSGTYASITSPWNTTNGYGASTTGNITGIYDMAGGKHEYVAAFTTGTTAPTGDAKYYDIYGNTSYKYKILGDGTAEVLPASKWYNEGTGFISSSADWFARGGCSIDGVLAGFFSASGYNIVDAGIGSRLVLSPSR